MQDKENEVSNEKKDIQNNIPDDTPEPLTEEVLNEAKNQGLVIITQAIAEVKNFDGMLAVANQLVNSSLVPFKKVEDVIMAWQYGLDIGLSFSQSMNELYPIDSRNGKRICAGVHVHEGILLASSKIKFKVIEDGVEVNHYVVRGLGTVILSMEEVMKKIDEGFYQVVVESDFDSNKKLIVPQVGKYLIRKVDCPYLPDGVTDRRTRIRFIREDKGIDEMVDYHLHEAYQANYMGKLNWQQQQTFMLYTRCFTKGSRRYGSDLLKNLQEITEIADTNNIPYTMDKEHKVTLDAEFEEIKD